jgi:uncharacterized membrane protein required for colicin V production
VGIAVDILVVLFLLWSLIRGWRLGFLYQVGHLAALIVSYFAARGLASLIERPLASALSSSPLLAGTIAFFSVFAVLAIIGAILVRKMTKDLIPDTSGLSQVNRFLGAVASLLKGALIAYLGVVLLVQIAAVKHTNAFGASVAVTWVAKNQDFIAKGRVGAVTKLAWLLGTRDMVELGRDPRFQRLLAHPKASVLQSPEVLGAIGKNDYVALLSNDRLWEYLDDPDVRSTLAEFDWVETGSTK